MLDKLLKVVVVILGLPLILFFTLLFSTWEEKKLGWKLIKRG